MRPEIVDPTETIDLQPITWLGLRKIPRPALIHLISASDPKAYPGASLKELSRDRLMSLACREKVPNEYIYSRFETTPGIFNRLHLSLWNDAFPEDDKDYCLKMRFAAAFLDQDNNIVVRSQNRRMTAAVPGGGERLCSGEECVRNGIASRTDAVMGDCGHAYLWGVRELLKVGWTARMISSLAKYEAGFHRQSPSNPDIWYEPWIGKEPAYTCLYCITVLRFILDQPEVTVLKALSGQPPAWVKIDLTKAFYDEAVEMAQRQGLRGLKVPTDSSKPIS